MAQSPSNPSGAGPHSSSSAPAGRPLPPSLQHQFEIEMGRDFSNVRVHENHGPTLVGAQAYTRGSDIHFAPGQYQPHDPAGSKLLAHELAHVVQQGGPSGPQA